MWAFKKTKHSKHNTRSPYLLKRCGGLFCGHAARLFMRCGGLFCGHAARLFIYVGAYLFIYFTSWVISSFIYLFIYLFIYSGYLFGLLFILRRRGERHHPPARHQTLNQTLNTQHSALNTHRPQLWLSSPTPSRRPCRRSRLLRLPGAV